MLKPVNQDSQPFPSPMELWQ